MKKIIVMIAFCLLNLSLFSQEEILASLPFTGKIVAVLKFEGGSGL